MLSEKTNYVTVHNNRRAPVIVPLSAVDVDLPPYIPKDKITAIYITSADLPVIQYEVDNGGSDWCYLDTKGEWHYPMNIRTKQNEKARTENMYRRIKIEGYKAKKREAKKPRKEYFGY